MNLVVLSPEDYWAKREPLDQYIPDDEATDAFWAALDSAQESLHRHLSQLMPEERGTKLPAWELPGHSQQCRVLYAYLYADSLYTPRLLPGIASVIPQDGKPWCAELECYTDARMLPNGNPLCIGWLVIMNDTAYANRDQAELIAYAERLGLKIA